MSAEGILVSFFLKASTLTKPRYSSSRYTHGFLVLFPLLPSQEKQGFAWEGDTGEETSTQLPSCRMYKPFADHKPVALESTKPRRPHPTYKPSQRAWAPTKPRRSHPTYKPSQRTWAKPVSETPVPRGRPGFDKSMPPPLPRPARGRTPLSQQGGGRMTAPPEFSKTHHRCRGGNARAKSPHRHAVSLWGESHLSI